MTTYDEAPVEPATGLALEEKAKLKKSLRRFDMVFFTLCALVGLDTLGSVASNGSQGFLWLVVMAITFVVPYMLLMSEIGSTFTEEGGPYEWVKLAFGRVHAGVAAVVYWASNPFWVGGSLSFIAGAAWAASDLPSLGIDRLGSVGDVLFKLLFIWFSIIVAIASIEKGKWIPNAGAIARILVLGFFTITLVVYAAQHGVEGFDWGHISPTWSVFFALTPVILFNYVGFELQNGAAEEMVNPQRDVPVSVLRSGALGVLLYCLPVLGILLVLPKKQITGIDGFVDAVKTTFSVYGGAQNALFILAALGFIFTLMTSGAVWMIGADRVLAVAAYDGAFFPWFGVFNRKLGTPVRVNVLSGVTASIFMGVAVAMLKSGSAGNAFKVVLSMATSTTLLSYLWIFPAAFVLRRRFPGLRRPYRVPGGNVGIAVVIALVFAWVLLGSFVAIAPGILEKIVGAPYDFRESWGVGRWVFHGLTLGTLAAMFLVAALGYRGGRRVRENDRAHETADRANHDESDQPSRQEGSAVGELQTAEGQLR
jgi:amino acid transporter